LSYLHLVEAIGERKRKNHTRALARLAGPGGAGRGQWARMHDMRVNGPTISRFNPCGCAASGRGGAGPMGAHARHAREWSGDFPLQPLRVRGFLLLLGSFACMEEIALAYLVSNYFLYYGKCVNGK